MKFSTSPNRNGLINVISTRAMSIIIMPSRSLIEKNGWNGILSGLELIPRGLLDPVWCKNIRWTMDRAAIINGRRKCRAKNRVSVALSIANPPQTH